MAVIDYGAVLFKNGVQQNHEMFMDMLKAVGWVDNPRIKYPDCDCFYDGYQPGAVFSNCEECPRAEWIHVDGETQSWDYVGADCRGNSTHVSGGIDGNYFVYVGDKHFTAVFYKNRAGFYEDGKRVSYWYGAESSYDRQERWYHKSARLVVGGVSIHIKEIAPNISWARFSYKGDHYDVVYGYGIDHDRNTWNEIKVSYLGRKCARLVDRVFNKIEKHF